MSHYKTQLEFQNELQDIRNKHHQQYQHDYYNYFIDYYQEHIESLYQIILQYYDIKYIDFIQFIYNTSLH